MKKILVLGLVCLSSFAQARSIALPTVEAYMTKTGSVQIEKVNPIMQFVTGGQVTIESGKMTLNLNRPTPCPADGDCVVAAPTQIKLNVVSVEFSNCGDTYTAETPNSLNGLNQIHETVRLVDMSEAVCDLMQEGKGRMEYVASSGPENTGAVYFRIDQIAKK